MLKFIKKHGYIFTIITCFVSLVLSELIKISSLGREKPILNLFFELCLAHLVISAIYVMFALAVAFIASTLLFVIDMILKRSNPEIHLMKFFSHRPYSATLPLSIAVTLTTFVAVPDSLLLYDASILIRYHLSNYDPLTISGQLAYIYFIVLNSYILFLCIKFLDRLKSPNHEA